MSGIPITRGNIHQIAADLDIDAGELHQKVIQSEMDYKKEQDFEYILSFFNEDKEWYEAAKVKVQKIEDSLPEDMDYKERTIKTYGWIEEETEITGSLDIPMQMDEKYSHAHAIEMVFTGKIDLYNKIMNWD